MNASISFFHNFPMCTINSRQLFLSLRVVYTSKKNMNVRKRLVSHEAAEESYQISLTFQKFRSVYRHGIILPPTQSQTVEDRPFPELTHGHQNKTDDSFQESVSSVTTFVQFLALMPVSGTSKNVVDDLKFSWKSFRTIYTLFYIGYGIFTSILYFMSIYDDGINAKNIGNCTLLI